MKKISLLILGKLILLISSILWMIPFRWAFRLHQWLDNKIIYWHHKHKINILE